MDKHDREKLDDPLSRLEHNTNVMIKKKAQNERLVDLKDDSHAKYKHDYEMNKVLRKNLRYSLQHADRSQSSMQSSVPGKKLLRTLPKQLSSW